MATHGDRRYLGADRDPVGEGDSEPMIWALATGAPLLPAPARVEFFRVACGERLNLGSRATALLSEWDAGGM